MINRKISSLSHEGWRKVRSKYCNASNFDLVARTENLLLIKGVLDSVGLRFWLSNGTALAAGRENDWIPWDDDVDIDVLEEEFRLVFDEVVSRFLDAGFIVRQEYRINRTKLGLVRKKEKSSLRALFLDKSYKNNKYRLRKSYKYPKRFFTNESTIDFKGSSFLVPNTLKDYLIYVYGDKWYKPIKSDDESKYSTRRIRR